MLFNIRAETKICNFDSAIDGKENIVWLNISVNDALQMKKANCAEDLWMERKFDVE